MVTGPTDAIKELWKSGFFEKEVSLWDIENKLRSIRLNPGKPAINIALKRSNFIKYVGKTSNDVPLYIEKYGPSEEETDKEEIIYSKGYVYDFYRDIKQILQTVKNELFIVDNYVNEDLFDVYVEKIPDMVNIKILTSPTNIPSSFITVAKKFSLQNSKRFEARKSIDCHDRVIFVDNDAWVVGQSLKDAGKKPTYLIRVNKSQELKGIFNSVWNTAEKIF